MTIRDVSSTLRDELVPRYADELTILVRDEIGSSWVVCGSERRQSTTTLAPELWAEVATPGVWLSAHKEDVGTDGGWVPLDLGAGVEPPPTRRIALPISMSEGPAFIMLDRAADRAAWTAIELMIVHEGVRLAEFALSAAQQHRRTLEARAVADAAAHRWTAFARLSRQLARSVLLDDVVTAILGAVVPYLADWALLDVFTADQKRERGVRRHALPGDEPLLEGLTQFPFGEEAKDLAIERLGATGWLLTEPGAAELARTSVEREHAVLARLAPRSVAVVPLVAGGRPLGALTLVTAASGQQYDRGDLMLFRSLADQAALALSSARLYGAVERARMQREELVAMVSHDLKSPLNILGFALAILGEEGIPKEKKAQQLGIMRRALAQMEELTNNLVDAARIDAGQFSVSPVPQDASALAHEALKRAEPLAEKRSVALETDGLDGLPTILADRRRLMQVFANVLENAISFTPAGGRVCLRAFAREDAVCFEVEDSGPGLEPELMEHVFDRFWQARHSGQAGAGLGLAIARGIVNAHGGTIGVRSADVSGAVFYFSISRAPTESASGPLPPPGHACPPETTPTGR
jgi:signal transduction histidine kinase